MTAPIPPIGAEFSRLAYAAPDEPAVTYEGCNCCVLSVF
jgi:hypothetical protein